MVSFPYKYLILGCPLSNGVVPTPIPVLEWSNLYSRLAYNKPVIYGLIAPRTDENPVSAIVVKTDLMYAEKDIHIPVMLPIIVGGQISWFPTKKR